MTDWTDMTELDTEEKRAAADRAQGDEKMTKESHELAKKENPTVRIDYNTLDELRKIAYDCGLSTDLDADVELDMAIARGEQE